MNIVINVIQVSHLRVDCVTRHSSRDAFCSESEQSTHDDEHAITAVINSSVFGFSAVEGLSSYSYLSLLIAN